MNLTDIFPREVVSDITQLLHQKETAALVRKGYTLKGALQYLSEKGY